MKSESKMIPRLSDLCSCLQSQMSQFEKKCITLVFWPNGRISVSSSFNFTKFFFIHSMMADTVIKTRQLGYPASWTQTALCDQHADADEFWIQGQTYKLKELKVLRRCLGPHHIQRRLFWICPRLF